MLKDKLALLKKFIHTCPNSTGVYKMLGINKEVLYVGKAKSLKSRLSDYLQLANLSIKNQKLIAKIDDIDVITTNNETEALILESNLIKKFKPKYNILLKDDKSFPYIFINEQHEYPMITSYRGDKKKDGTYFGPFTSKKNVDESLSLLQKAFLLRSCSDAMFKSRTRPCILYQLKRCSAPCVHKISSTAYHELVLQAKDFLSSKTHDLQNELIKKMEEASEQLDYEKAAICRDRIKALSSIQVKQVVDVNTGSSDFDVIAVACTDSVAVLNIFFIRSGKNLGNKIYNFTDIQGTSHSEIISDFISTFYQNNTAPSEIITSHLPQDQKFLEDSLSSMHSKRINIIVPKRGVKHDLLKFAMNNTESNLKHKSLLSNKYKNMLEELKKFFGMSKDINRIEVYDNSHISGTNAIGAMVVFSGNGFNKAEYRKYNIKFNDANKGIPDDYYMMSEMLTRRLKNTSNLPELMIIDGGLGHMSTATKVCDPLGVKVFMISLAKGVDRNSGNETIYTSTKDVIILNKDDKIKQFLQVLRDEAHRFAITSHRKKRTANMTKSRLDDIPGIGKKRKSKLLNFFGSLDGLRTASIEELQHVEGINQKVAEKIYSFFHKDV